MKKQNNCEFCKTKILEKYQGHGAVLVQKLSPIHKYWICPICALYGAVHAMDKPKKIRTISEKIYAMRKKKKEKNGDR